MGEVDEDVNVVLIGFYLFYFFINCFIIYCFLLSRAYWSFNMDLTEILNDS
jgi:hypothetical protein